MRKKAGQSLHQDTRALGRPNEEPVTATDALVDSRSSKKAKSSNPSVSPEAKRSAPGFSSKYKPEELIIIGKVGKANGTRGFFQIGLETDYPERFETTKEVHIYLDPLDGWGVRRMVVESAESRGSKWLLKFRGIDRPEEVLTVMHRWIAVPESDLTPLPDGEYYHFQLEGLQVVDESGLPSGTLKEVLSLPAHDIYVINSPTGEVLVPAVPQYIHEIDVQKGFVRLTLPHIEPDAPAPPKKIKSTVKPPKRPKPKAT
jgi:16S rRNA processing protein RimM